MNSPPETFSLSADGTFSMSFTGLIGGEHLFALLVKDKDGRDPGLLSFGIELYGQFVVDNIFVPPTLGFESAIVGRGKDLQIIGYASPNNKTEIEIRGNIIGEAQADASGYYNFVTSTSGFAIGEHYVRVRQVDQSDPPRFGEKNKKSNFSINRTFKVSVLASSKTDFNQDDKVNISDWSIFLFQWGSDNEQTRLKNDLNGDGKVDVFDLSIFLRSMNI